MVRITGGFQSVVHSFQTPRPEESTHAPLPLASASMGAWEDFLLLEMLPAIEQRFKCGGSGRRGVFGKSSGGYGAVTHALRHSDIWSAAACHSGDMGFELCYLPDMPAVLRALAGAE